MSRDDPGRNDLVSRADSLMQRRSFVAAASPPPADLDADVPVLTDEVLPEAVDVSGETAAAFATPPATPLAAEPVAEPAPAATDLAAGLAEALERRLAADLPALLEAGLGALQAELQRGIREAVADTARRFVADHGCPASPVDTVPPGSET